ncbi:jg16238 [Pararge aegeria aegeria]|uniref:Jg16238 protein n=1 Tax=Pararge aegeria aegeria TaxID=348720 RepID=A0A8S4RXF1_9NEOP|nr:jg16238 [Pararge aegeria aegeria]
MSQITTRSGDTSQDEKLLMPFIYIQQVPGKQIRSKLTLAFNYWLKVSDEKLRAIGEIVQMLHNSSLLVDDIEDNSILRRGIPVAHSIYGIASTINAANFVVIIALDRTLQLGHPMVTSSFVAHILRQRTRDVEVKRYCISLLEKFGSFQYTRERLQQLDDEARAEVKRLGGNPHLEELLDELLSWRRDSKKRNNEE